MVVNLFKDVEINKLITFMPVYIMTKDMPETRINDRLKLNSSKSVNTGN